MTGYQTPYLQAQGLQANECFKKLQCSVICLSLTLPPHALEIKDIAPWGITEIFQYNYDVYRLIRLRALRFEGRSMKTSKQSIMTAAHLVLKCFLNSIGIVFWSTSLSGPTTNDIREHPCYLVGTEDTLNAKARYCSGRLSRSFWNLSSAILLGKKGSR